MTVDLGDPILVLHLKKKLPINIFLFMEIKNYLSKIINVELENLNYGYSQYVSESVIFFIVIHQQSNKLLFVLLVTIIELVLFCPIISLIVIEHID